MKASLFESLLVLLGMLLMLAFLLTAINSQHQPTVYILGVATGLCLCFVLRKG